MKKVSVSVQLACECTFEASGRDAAILTDEYMSGQKQWCWKHQSWQGIMHLDEEIVEVHIPRTSVVWN